jgi:hypothetical protein
MREPPNRILEFLTIPARPDGEASRSNRRRPSDARIELSWVDGAGWRTARARLRDISRGGASMVTLYPPPITRRARLRFVEGEGSPWVEAEILGVEQETPKRYRVRLRFESPCPSFMLRLAVLGVIDDEQESPSNRHEWVAWRPELAE